MLVGPGVRGLGFRLYGGCARRRGCGFGGLGGLMATELAVVPLLALWPTVPTFYRGR